jgi:hypothetical protein
MQSETLDKLAFLFLGWLLGLLGPVIVDAIKRQRENKLGREALRTELSVLRIKLAFVYYTIEEHQGTMNRQSLKWIIKQLSTAPNDSKATKVCSALRKFLDATDEELSQYFLSKKSPAGQSLTMQSYGTPLLDARVSALWSFDTASQRTLLEIRSAFDIAAEIVERGRHFHNLTFQKLENGNHARAVENIEGCYDQYAKQAKRIVELIEVFDNLAKA